MMVYTVIWAYLDHIVVAHNKSVDNNCKRKKKHTRLELFYCGSYSHPSSSSLPVVMMVSLCCCRCSCGGCHLPVV